VIVHTETADRIAFGGEVCQLARQLLKFEHRRTEFQNTTGRKIFRAARQAAGIRRRAIEPAGV
jgi:hypothetical protein